MDISLYFHSCVKTIREYNQVIEQPNKSNIISKVSEKQHVFIAKVCSITEQIEKLYELFNYTKYLKVSQFFSNKNCITNIGNDEIYSLAENMISICSRQINDLKLEILASNVSQQNQENRQIIIMLVEEYLKQVSKLHIEQKAVQIKKSIEIRNISKLKPMKYKTDGFVEDNIPLQNIKNPSEEKTFISEVNSLKIHEINEDIIDASCDNQLSAEDIQIFDAENKQLYNDLNILSNEMKQIESKVVQITELQDIFSEKILHQDKNLERVLVTIVGSTENVREANEQIRSAIQRNAGLRVWVLFFLLVISLTLIFLDWYNP